MRIQFKNYEDGAVIEPIQPGGKSTYEMAAGNAQNVIALMAMVAIGEKRATARVVKKAMLDAVDHLRKQIYEAEVVDESC